MADRIDPLTLAVIRGSLEQVADEMDATLERMAFSPVISSIRARTLRASSRRRLLSTPLKNLSTLLRFLLVLSSTTLPLRSATGVSSSLAVPSLYSGAIFDSPVTLQGPRTRLRGQSVGESFAQTSKADAITTTGLVKKRGLVA
jgi:hypothetical protein